MARLFKKSMPLIGVVILLAIIGFFLIKTDKGESEKETTEQTVPKADISSEDFIFTESDPDKGTKLTLEADEGSFSTENGYETGRFKGFRLKYQTKDALDFEFEGMDGEINRAKNEISLSGGLKGKTREGYGIYIEQITIQQNENCIKSDETVTVEGPFFRITGKGLYMDLEKKTLKILKDVNSVFDTGAVHL
jgi:LPS export ABC transporter protein LptC